MKLYTISELEELNEEEINQVLHDRCGLLVKLMNDAIKGIQIHSFGSKSGDTTKLYFNIENIEYKKNDTVNLNNDFIITPINVYLAGYNSKSKTGTIYHDYSTGGLLNSLIEKHLDKGARVHWGIKKLQGQNHVNFDLLFPSNLIIPDILAYKNYQNYTNNKKNISKINEDSKKKFESKLLLNINEMKINKFNLLMEDHLYVPDNKDELMNFIEKASKNHDQESLNAVVKKYSDNEEIVLAAIGFMNDKVFEYASDRLKDDKKFVNYCIDNHKANILAFASERIRDDEVLLLKAIKAVGGQIMRAGSNRLKNDKDICLIAIKDRAIAYQYISEELKIDDDIILTLIEQKPDFFKPCPIIKNNKNLLISAFKNAYPDSSNLLLTQTSDELKNDTQVALAAIECCERNIQYIGDKLKAEIGDLEPFAYLKKIDLYKEIDQEITDNTNQTKRKIKM